MNIPHTERSLAPSFTLGFAAFVGLVFASGWIVESVTAPASTAELLHAAAPARADDYDRDGLPDTLEASLGTSPDNADSDRDGYTDAEEYARRSDPLNRDSAPRAEDVQLQMYAYQQGRRLHPLVAIYVNGDFRDAGFQMGVLLRGALVYVPIDFWLKHATITVVPTGRPGESVMVFEPTVSTQMVFGPGQISFFATLQHNGTIAAADALNLAAVGGSIIEREYTAFRSDMANPSVGTSQGGSSVYSPIGGGSQDPSSWSAGEICAQGLAVAGVNGPIVTQEVVSADCAPDWDSFCDSSCAGTVGDTVQVLDPVVLIGG